MIERVHLWIYCVKMSLLLFWLNVQYIVYIRNLNENSRLFCQIQKFKIIEIAVLDSHKKLN